MCLSFCLSVDWSVYLCFIHLFIYLSLSISIYLFLFVSISIYTSIHLSIIHPSISPSIHLLIFPSIQIHYQSVQLLSTCPPKSMCHQVNQPSSGSLLCHQPRSPEYKKALKADLEKNMNAVVASKTVAVQSLASSQNMDTALADPCPNHNHCISPPSYDSLCLSCHHMTPYWIKLAEVAKGFLSNHVLYDIVSGLG